jgi:putative DNA primase/helicase
MTATAQTAEEALHYADTELNRITNVIIPSAARTVDGAMPELKLNVFGLQAEELMGYVRKGVVDHQRIVDALQEIAQSNGLVEIHGQDEIQSIMTRAAQAFNDAPTKRTATSPPLQPRTSAQEWPDPHPLPEALQPVDPFDFNLLPEKLRPWGADATERMQCPPDYVGASIVAALGTVIGTKLVIKPKIEDDWQVVANQWCLIIGRPGLMKSPAMEEALRPLKRLCAEAEQEFKATQDSHDVDEKIAKLQAADALKQASKLFKNKSSEAEQKARDLLAATHDPAEPKLRRYIANDTNIASLGVLLQQNPNGLLVFRDELVSLLRSLDQDERESEKGFYLTAWNGNSGYTFDRIGRGLHLSIDRICLSMLGSTQPGRISEYLSQAIRGGRGDDGLMQRFGLLVWPDISGEWKHVDRWPDDTARTASFEVFNRLDKLDWRGVGARRDRGPDGDEEGLPYLRFNIDAYDRFVDWRTDLEKRLRGDLHPALESHLAKYRKLVPGLALIFHLVDHGVGPVGMPAIERAIAWARYLEKHAHRAYGSITFAAAATAQAILAKLRSGALKPEFSSRDVWRPGWSRLTDPDVVHAGLRMLVDYDHLAEAKVEKTGGRPAVVYTANPKTQLCVQPRTAKNAKSPERRPDRTFGSFGSA